MRKEPIIRKTFSKIRSVDEMPDLLDIQLSSFRTFLQHDVLPGKRKAQGLQEVFQSLFPILDSRENYLLEFVEYYIDPPKFSVDECRERGVTYAVPMKAKLRLSVKDTYSEETSYVDTLEQVVYLGNFPFMTDRGTFIINGAERIIVNQLHRSPGVFFDEKLYPNGTRTFSARIIPFRGSWLEFMTDTSDVLYVYVDQGRKFPVTTLLRALGCASDEEVLRLFSLIEEATLKDPNIKKYVGRMVFFSQDEVGIVDEESGELILERDGIFEEEHIPILKKMGVKKLKFIVHDDRVGGSDVINNTLRKDTVQSEQDAIEAIYRQLRSGDPPDLETARALIDRLFFNPKRYDLGRVGRYRMNRKLGLDIDEETTVLTNEDFVAIVKHLLALRSGTKTTDDIDHLGNRRVRTIGEQLAAQMSVGLSRMARTIKERLNLGDSDRLTPQELVNARTVMSVINTFFGTSQLSQFMDQTNPLAELTHKRRLSALGPGGLTRERAGFEVRDVHYTHYGRLCPIETPEGPNIGLISSIATYAQINGFGFLETPYRRIDKGVATQKIEYLSADDEEQYIIVQANAPLDKKGRFLNERVKTRYKGEFPVVPPESVNYMDVSPNQIVSAAAALIPFLEHDDANRALMGSNMQRQSVPLLQPESPLVGTGMEMKVAKDSRALLVSSVSGTVERVTAKEVTIRVSGSEKRPLWDFNEEQTETYKLTKFLRTNQDTMINQKPLVSEGDKIKKGDVLADGCGTDRGELSLGRNVLVAFIPWRGYNFEDAIVISERVVREDIYTSIHIEEFELQVRDTKRGEEELTREIPNVSEEATKNLDDNGVIRVGAEVHAGDILVGKVTPKGETEPTPEEKLLKAIFGEKAGDVKDASLKAPPGMNGIVIDTKMFSLKRRDPKTKKKDKKLIEEIESRGELRRNKLKEMRDDKLRMLLEGKTSVGIQDSDNQKVLIRKGLKFSDRLFGRIDFDLLDWISPWVDDDDVNQTIGMIYQNYLQQLTRIEDQVKQEKDKIAVGDELPPGIIQLVRVYVARKRKLQVGDKMAGRHGNKGVVAKVVPVEDMPYLPDGTPVDIVLNPLGVPSRMNLGQILETNLGWAAKILGHHYATPVFDGATEKEVKQEMEKAGLSLDGKSDLFDGRSGEKFDQKVTVGYIYMMKLSHLVEDKIHARSIGPYSLITQQPLGGKAQFGGQRFGEMEVWALEAYGAAHTLQEILTVKSDDVRGRAKAYEAIVKGENLPKPGIPESFHVLLKELMGLGLDVELR
ncbi:DNA-directed RNA polymerase subunit beta [bacterium I07]|nr:DNA-directed RNA polymerase subunit beta [bacterium I07]